MKDKVKFGDIVKTVVYVAGIAFGVWILSFGFRMLWTVLHDIYIK